MTIEQKNNLSIVSVTPSVWDKFVATSKQATVFNQSFFLASYQLPVNYLICQKGEEQIAGFSAIETAEGVVMMPYLVYNGILFKDLSDLKPYRRQETTFAAMETLAAFLLNRYKQVDFVNHWTIQDARPFEWLNFHERDKGYYKISFSYTSHLDISNPRDTSGYARARIRDLQKDSVVDAWQTHESTDIDILLRLHDRTFARNGVVRSPMAQQSFKSVCQAVLDAKAAKLYVTSKGGVPVAASLYVYDNKRAYHLAMGTDDEGVDNGCGTKNFYDAAILLHDTLQINQLDLVGINNPQRARYKLSYGGEVVPYLRMTKVVGGV